jgi:hypothetical protein
VAFAYNPSIKVGGLWEFEAIQGLHTETLPQKNKKKVICKMVHFSMIIQTQVYWKLHSKTK